MEISKEELAKYIREGKEVEKRYMALHKNAVLSTKEEDMKDHYDVCLITNVSIVTKVDVKGIKKISRNYDNVDENYHWIEIKGANGGWLYGGKSDRISFETEDYFIDVETEKLKDFIKKKVKKEYVQTPEEALYKLYHRRKDKTDLLTRVKTIDLMRIAIEIKDKI